MNHHLVQKNFKNEENSFSVHSKNYLLCSQEWLNKNGVLEEEPFASRVEIWNNLLWSSQAQAKEVEAKNKQMRLVQNAQSVVKRNENKDIGLILSNKVKQAQD